MFNKKEFEDIYQSIKNNQKDKAQKNLKFFREKYDLDPDYLYLMAEFLILEKRFYQAIDTIHVSLLVENDDRFLLKNNFVKIGRKLNFKLFNKNNRNLSIILTSGSLKTRDKNFFLSIKPIKDEEISNSQNEK